MAASTQEESNEESATSSDAADDGVADDAPEASAQAASTAAADGSAGGTTVKIAVYRSSYQLSWDLNDEHGVESLMATWANGTREAPEWWEAVQGSPGSQVECPSEYSRDAEPKRTGYAFLGWSTDPAAPKGQMLDELAIPSDAEIAGEGDERTIALHAIWTPIEYSVVFDLTKNPEDASAVPSFAWTTGKGEFSDLGNGRYRLHGITLDDYDPETGLIEIATPSRGTGGYRFLSWAEPESQQDPAVAMRRSGSAKWFVNPVALPHYGYEPVLTARWGLSFDVDVPSQITFDQYDSLEVEGSLTDSTSKEDVDEESPDAHDAGKQAHFCSQSTATDYRIVGLESVRAASADDVLTTSDSTKATHEEVLGSERLLSMFASADRSESAGVHFRLDDEVDMDQARYSSFVIPRQQAGFDSAAPDRDAESRLYVSYRLNLDNRVDGAAEPNHGLVAAANVADGVRTRIASVSYEFAVADYEVDKTIPGDPLYIEDNGSIYGLDYIKRAAEDISAASTASQYYEQFKGYLDSGMDPDDPADPHGYVRWGDGTTYNVRIIGINHDDLADGSGKAGLTFQFVSLLNEYHEVSSTSTHAGGWRTAALQLSMNSADGSIYQDIPGLLREGALKLVSKLSHNTSGMSVNGLSYTEHKMFVLSVAELTGTTGSNPFSGQYPWVITEGSQYEYWRQQAAIGNTTNAALKKGTQANPAAAQSWWTRTPYPTTNNLFVAIAANGHSFSSLPVNTRSGVAPAFCL